MHLSHQQPPSKFNKSLDIPKFGRPTRSPRTPSTSLQSYSDTFEESSQKLHNYSDTFISESEDVSHERDTKQSTTVIETLRTDRRYQSKSLRLYDEPTEVPTERIDTVISGYIESEHPRTVTVGIETCISELETDQFRTVTERLESEGSDTERLESEGSDTERLESEGSDTERLESQGSDTERLESQGSDTERLESQGSDTERLESQGSDTERLESQGSDKERTNSYSSPSHHYSYSDTFQSTFPSKERSYEDSYNYSKSEEVETKSEYSDSHTVGYSHMSASGTLTDLSSPAITFEEYTLSSEVTERDYSLEFEEDSEKYDYSSEFEATDSQDSEKLLQQQLEEEERQKAAEARENFMSHMISVVRQKPFREMDIEELIDREIEDMPEEEDLPPQKILFLKKKLHLLKKKKKKGDPVPAPEINQWETHREQRITDYGLHPAIMEKLKLKNFIMAMERAAKSDFHDPRKCKECREHESAIDTAAAERNFVRIKTRDIRQRVMEDHYHKHLVKMDSINLIADIARSLPRHTDDPQDIEDQLNKGLNLSKSVTQNRVNGSG